MIMIIRNNDDDNSNNNDNIDKKNDIPILTLSHATSQKSQLFCKLCKLFAINFKLQISVLSLGTLNINNSNSLY